MNNLPGTLLVDSLLANPDVAVYTNDVGLAYMMHSGLEEPAMLGTSESRYIQNALKLGTMEHVLTDIYESEALPLGSLTPVAHCMQKTSPELLYSAELAKRFNLYEQLVIQKHINMPQFNFGPLLIFHILNPKRIKGMTDYGWVTNSGSGHVDVHPMTEGELQGIKSLIAGGTFIQQDEERPFYTLRVAEVIAQPGTLPAYSTMAA